MREWRCAPKQSLFGIATLGFGGQDVGITSHAFNV
jgi:hypothetical protein